MALAADLPGASLYARYGKASKGSPPKRRTILTIPEMDCVLLA